MKKMYRVLYWNEKKELLSFNTISTGFKETIDKFYFETDLNEDRIYSINIIQ